MSHPPRSVNHMDGVHPRHDAEAAQLPLELEGVKDPVPYALTAKARRAVAPDSLPDLAVVGDGTAPAPRPDEDAEGTARARARALRRAGLDPAAIADELHADADSVRGWVRDVQPVHTARRRLRAVGDGGQASLERGRTSQAFEAARRRAATAAERRPDDGAFATGLGLVAGIAEVTPHAVVLSSRDPGVAAAALRWLRDAAEVPRERIRVALRVAPQVAGDLAAHRWAEALDIDVATVTVSRWSQAPDAEAVRAMIRISGPEYAGQVAGWRDVLMRTLDAGVDDPGSAHPPVAEPEPPASA